MVVADSGPLIALARLELLPVLREQFEVVLVPEDVFEECTAQGHRPGARTIAASATSGLLERVTVADAARFAGERLLDPGEAAAIRLAQVHGCPVLVDERRGRRVAVQLGVYVVGTVVVLVAARQAGLVPALTPLFEKLLGFGYRVPPELIGEALRRVNER